MRGPARYTGDMLMGIGALHTALGLVLFRRRFGERARKGPLDTVEGRP